MAVCSDATADGIPAFDSMAPRATRALAKQLEDRRLRSVAGICGCHIRGLRVVAGGSARVIAGSSAASPIARRRRRASSQRIVPRRGRIQNSPANTAQSSAGRPAILSHPSPAAAEASTAAAGSTIDGGSGDRTSE